MLLSKHITFDFLQSVVAINELLIEWKARALERDLIVGDCDIKKKATSLAEFFHVKTFNTSDQWLSRFNTAFAKRLTATSAKRKRKEKEKMLDTGSILADIRHRLHSDTYERFMSYVTEAEKLHPTSNASRKFKKLKQSTVRDLLKITPAQVECTLQKEIAESEDKEDDFTHNDKIDFDESSSDSDVVEIKAPTVVVDITEDDDDDGDDINQRSNVPFDQDEFACSSNEFSLLKNGQIDSETEIALLEAVEGGTLEKEKDCDEAWELFVENYDGHDSTKPTRTLTDINKQQLAVVKECDELKTDHEKYKEEESQHSDNVDVFELVEYSSDDEGNDMTEYVVEAEQLTNSGHTFVSLQFGHSRHLPLDMDH